MLKKIDIIHKKEIHEYLNRHQDEVLYFIKPFEQSLDGTFMGAFYGFFIEGHLSGLLCFLTTNALVIHFENPKILGHFSVLQTIKMHQPRFIKGLSIHIDAIERILYKSVASMTSTHVQLMRCDALDKIPLTLDGFALVSLYENRLSQSLKFFIEVEQFFGRQVFAVNDIVKNIRRCLEKGHALIAYKEDSIIGQGIVEEETEDFAIIGGIYVAKEHRKKGIGTAITLALTDQCLQKKRSVYLFVKNNNHEARHIYASIGYKDVNCFQVSTVTYS